MPIDDVTAFEISNHGEIGNEAIERAKERTGRIGSHCREVVELGTYAATQSGLA